MRTASTDRPEPKTSLASLVAAPIVWAAHFLLSYGTVAIWCAKRAGPERSLGGASVAIASYTIVALIAIGIIGRRAWRQHRIADAAPEDRDSPEARHRFVAGATLLLAGLAAIAILYAALAVAVAGSCR
jgi:hypothetical protein